jgi:glycine dehydrogenase subunit 1
MRYLPLTEKERKKILADCKASSFEELTDQVPQNLRVGELLKIEESLDEQSLVSFFQGLSQKNIGAEMTSFLGQGAYDHFWPTVIDQISNRGEFLTAYTPYQPEISQGTLQVIFEYQSMVSELTGFEVSNASLYDGATSVVEGVLMAARLQNMANGTVIINEGMYGRYREVVESYLRPLGFELEVWSADKTTLTSTAQNFSSGTFKKPVVAVVLQSPNTWGQIENWAEAKSMAQKLNTKSIAVVTHGHSLAKFKSPGSFGLDICVGELQTFGIPVGFGGPYLGMICCHKKDVRQMPGRLVGLTTDSRGQRAFCITLATREQHIRREKATSNICSNQNLMATRACIYMSLLGPSGLLKVADVSKSHALYVKTEFQKIIEKKNSKLNLLSDNTFLNEWSILVPKSEVKFLSKFAETCEKNKVIGGVSVPAPKNLENIVGCIALAFTERHQLDQLNTLIKSFEESLS